MLKLKTAVGKTLKSDLRKLAISRVYGTTLADVDIGVTIAEVVEGKKFGLLYLVIKTAMLRDDDDKALGAFTRPWNWA